MIGLFSKSNSPVPLESVHWDINVIESIMELEISQTFVNKDTDPIEAEYVFPVEEDMAICGLTIRINEKILEAKLMEKEEAANKYSEAVASGHAGYMMSYDANQKDLLRLVVGNLLPGKKAIVSIKLVKKLDSELNALSIRIPTTFTPRYHNATDVSSEVPAAVKQKFVASDEITYTWTMTARITSAGKIAKIQCTSHKVSIKEGKDPRTAVVNLEGGPQIPDRDFVLNYTSEELNTPVVRIQKSPFYSEYATIVTFCPTTAEGKDPTATGLGEYIFILDCSGSMGGNRITLAKDALNRFLLKLPDQSLFNVYLFGSSFNSFFPKSVEYSPKNLAAAKNELSAVDSNMGGTEIYTLLEDIFSQACRPGYPRSLFLLTDGGVSNVEAVISLIRGQRKQTRVHTFGIGSGASNALIKGGAEAGNGHAEFVTEGESVTEKVLSTLRSASKPALSDINIEWPKGWSVIKSSLASAVYVNEVFVVYALCSEVAEGVAQISAIDTSDGKRVKYETKIGKENMDEGMGIYKIAARSIIKDFNLKKEEEVQLALKYNVLSPNTSYIVVDKQIEPSTGALKEVRVPVAITRDSSHILCVTGVATLRSFVDNSKNRCMQPVISFPDGSSDMCLESVSDKVSILKEAAAGFSSTSQFSSSSGSVSILTTNTDRVTSWFSYCFS